MNIANIVPHSDKVNFTEPYTLISMQNYCALTSNSLK